MQQKTFAFLLHLVQKSVHRWCVCSKRKATVEMEKHLKITHTLHTLDNAEILNRKKNRVNNEWTKKQIHRDRCTHAKTPIESEMKAWEFMGKKWFLSFEICYCLLRARAPIIILSLCSMMNFAFIVLRIRTCSDASDSHPILVGIVCCTHCEHLLYQRALQVRIFIIWSDNNLKLNKMVMHLDWNIRQKE